MLSYKQWKTLNESVLTTGIVSPSNLGAVGSPLGLEEAKFAKKKKMMVDDEDVTGDGEMVEPASPKDDPEEEEAGGCFKCGKMSGKKMKKMKKMWSDEDDQEDAPVEDEDMGGDEEDEDMGGGCGDEEEEEAPMDDVPMKGAPMKGKGAPPMFSKKKAKKMRCESDDWWASVRSMVNSDPDQKYNDGWTEYQEDALLPPADPNAAVTEPQPGDVGFAPQGRLGSGF